MTAGLLPALPAVIYYTASGIFQTAKPPTFGRWRYLAVITVVINTHILTILLLKFFSTNPNTHQRSKAHFLVITHGGVAPTQSERRTSVNNGCEQLAVHCSAVGTSHSSGDQVFTQDAAAAKASRQGEGRKQRLKETRRMVSEKDTHDGDEKKTVQL